MLVCAISDTHNSFDFDVPDADLLVHCGDISMSGTVQEFIDFNKWVGLVKKKFKYGIYLCPGNHDKLAQQNLHMAKSLVFNARICVDELVQIEDKKIYLTPWVPTYGRWSFMAYEQELYDHYYRKIPEGLDLLVSHGPPAGILDVNRYGNSCGSKALLKIIEEMKQPPKAHAFGHIHVSHNLKGGYPINKQPHEEFGCKFYNASIMSEEYYPEYKATMIEI